MSESKPQYNLSDERKRELLQKIQKAREAVLRTHKITLTDRQVVDLLEEEVVKSKVALFIRGVGVVSPADLDFLHKEWAHSILDKHGSNKSKQSNQVSREAAEEHSPSGEGVGEASLEEGDGSGHEGDSDSDGEAGESGHAPRGRGKGKGRHGATAEA